MKRKILEKLIDWKKKSDRKPLILNGARQVGKTYILREFGEKYYKNVIYINLEITSEVTSYFTETIDPEKIIRYLEAYANEEIIPGQTLIIFDEIQSCERALTSLKYFCENAPEFHIIAAGSLLGVAINRQNYSFPVGKVETMTLYPFNFEEFLFAMGEERLIIEIRNCYDKMEAMPEGLHNKAIELYRIYLIIGGMPACINAFMKNKKLLDVPNVQREILDNYIADMAKYSSNTESVKIRACYNSIPAQLAKENKKFQYKVVQKGGSVAVFGVSIEWLTLAGVIQKCQRIEQAFDPIAVYSDLSSFKLYMGDIGLLGLQAGTSHQSILSGEGNTFIGALTENYVAQELSAKGYNLFYWSSEHTAELDFVLQKEDNIYAIEVKKGTHTKSKSLGVFMQKFDYAEPIRFSSKNFGMTNKVKAIPLYAVFCF